MVMSYIMFENSKVKEAERKERKQARDAVLKKAEADYNSRKVKDERARLRGDDKWMLPSVETRINAETKKVKKKKHKKKKKAKRKSSSGSDSGDESKEEEWVEKVVRTSEEACAHETCEKAGRTHSGPNQDEYRPKNDVSHEKQEESEGPPRRDEWMTLPGLFPCVSREQLKQHSRQLSKAEEQRQKNRYLLDTLGQTDRELNPYWRDGGTGLPQEKKAEELGNRESQTLPVKSVGDHGLDWLQRALKRTKEQAANEGRNVEEVAAERWGNLEKLETMLAEAERKNRKQGRGTECERNKCEERSGRRKDKCDTESTRRAVDRLNTKSCDDQKHSDGTQHGRSHTTSKFYQTCGTDGDIHYGKHNKQDGHPFSKSRYSETSWTFQKPKEETDMSRREYTSRQDFAREVDSVAAPSSYKNPVASGNWRKKESESLRPPNSPTAMKSSSCKETKPYTRTESSSASSSSDSEAEKEETAEAQHILTDKEMNDLGAKLVKAEILGNETLAKELKKKLEAARAMKGIKKEDTPAAEEEEMVTLTRTDSRGFVRPLQQFGQHAEPVGGRRRKQKVETHAEGKRMRYYADDDKYSLRDLFEREKLGTVEDENEVFSRLAFKGAGRSGSEYDMDDIFAQQAQLKEPDGRVQSRERGKAIREHRMVDKVLQNCRWCFDSKNMLKHLIVAIGSKVYLCLPPYQSLTEGHCLIVPMYHTPCATQLDEDVWSEMQTFRKTLTSMFREKLDLDVVFFETAMYLRKFPHMLMECIPIPRESSDLAPIYFKKAILECETEWATNKKLVDLSGKDVRRAVPKGLPYFAVNFGLDSGFAHVIEDEKMFSKNFAQEIIGGMLDLDHSLWRKQRQENFDLQRKKVLKFAEWWKTYDFTVRKEKDSSDSEGTSFGTYMN